MAMVMFGMTQILLTAFLLAQNSAGGGAAVPVAFGAVWLLFLGLGLIATIFWIWMLIDCLGSSLAGTEKLIWVLVILFLHVLGAALYFFIARKGSARA